ncbi:MAG: hypothetical protein JJ850_00105 [Kordiimonadaceae bacterium]|nr:hypothetical protein [Kordiimonadaceae bacterium]MBO6567800.1 hypothetical protein [Kordiimonadaceae bacterium]MBO6962985.1 hypothetical protein [Kordiimonadaceae bacterium]
MQDTFSKICLGVIAASLAVLAGLKVYEVAAPTHKEARSVFAGGNNTQTVSVSTSKPCSRRIAELETTLETLQIQIKSVPEKIESSAGNEQAGPNKLFEQLMHSIVDTRTQLEAEKARCQA